MRAEPLDTKFNIAEQQLDISIRKKPGVNIHRNEKRYNRALVQQCHYLYMQPA
jgi:hypothetical protein